MACIPLQASVPPDVRRPHSWRSEIRLAFLQTLQCQRRDRLHRRGPRLKPHSLPARRGNHRSPSSQIPGVDSMPRSRAHRSAAGNHDLCSRKADPTQPASTGERPRRVSELKRTACRGEPLEPASPHSLVGDRSPGGSARGIGPALILKASWRSVRLFHLRWRRFRHPPDSNRGPRAFLPRCSWSESRHYHARSPRAG